MSKSEIIGITLGINQEKESMWVNGIKMNAIFLQKTLQKLGYTVYLLDTNKKVPRNKLTGKLDDDKVVWDSSEFPIYDFYKKVEEVDLLFLLGTSIGSHFIDPWRAKKPTRRTVKYGCGNNYVIDMEWMMHKNDEEIGKYTPPFNRSIDEVWYVPQQGYQNHHYYRVTHKVAPDKVKPVPFIWDPMFIDEVDNLYGNSVDENGVEIKEQLAELPVYIPDPKRKPEETRISIFEPNINVVKFSMIPMLICEDLWDKGTELKIVNIFSAGGLYKNSYWQKFIKKLNLVIKPKEENYTTKIAVQHRFPVHWTLAKFTDIVISHQWENPLNYAYLDCMYLQYPLLHNADMIKDAGYYYPDFDIDAGSNELQWILKNHDSQQEAYNAKNEEVLERYTSYNQDLLDTYQKLIDNLIEGKNKHNLSYKYNWKTNVYEDV
tara:strand:- start:2127 stop:3422 length:1296 start_codon:yes stop_codon:yes gene_type:complete